MDASLLAAKAMSRHGAVGNAALDRIADEGADACSSQPAQVLASVPSCRVSRIARGGVETLPEMDIVVIRAVSAADEEVVALVGSHEFRYPLCGQLLMRVRPGVYMLPASHEGETVCLRAEFADEVAVASLEAALVAFAVLRDRDTGELVAGAEGDGGAEAGEEGAVDARSAARSGTGTWTAFVTGLAAGFPRAPEDADAAPGRETGGSGQAGVGPLAKPASTEADGWRTAEAAVVGAGQWAATGLVLGARMAGSGVRRAGTAIASRSRNGREAEPEREDAEVSKSTLRNIRRARMASSAAVLVTRGLVVTMTELTKGMGRAVGALVGESDAGKAAGKRLAASTTAQGLKRVGLAGLVAVSDLWDALEEGLMTVGGDIGEATEEAVGARYGAAAASATREGMMVAGDAGQTLLNLRRVAPVGLAVNASKTAARRAVLGPERAEAQAAAERERRETERRADGRLEP
ncbi:hypothetical protein FNF29_06652 [Cafeteria roenbergensis]|uniref:Senescence domain-containing protein n=1 Tax=Cafeteria roenbergensis TaxID=33653 RepID=A0A5A8C6T5_CAFRO|nr:hypothetical protein FNF29_06652 [Cafeteria roenbergensis]|eukprot:KAA0148434.1 hypothetical protein FNF29_06652 [Cafeteria roenbergensis]